MNIPVDTKAPGFSAKLYKAREVFEYEDNKRTDRVARTDDGKQVIRLTVGFESIGSDGVDGWVTDVRSAANGIDDLVPMLGQQIVFPRGLNASPTGYNENIYWDAPEVASKSGKPAQPQPANQG